MAIDDLIGFDLRTSLFSDRAFEALCSAFPDNGIVTSFLVARDFDGEIILKRGDSSEQTFGPGSEVALMVSWWLECRFILDQAADPASLSESARVRKFLADWLRSAERSTFVSAYGEEFTDSIIGAPQDPFTVEKLKLKAAEIHSVDEKFGALLRDVLEEYYADMAEARASLNSGEQSLELYKSKSEAATKKYEAAREKLLDEKADALLEVEQAFFV